MSKIDSQHVCDILNSEATISNGFLEAIRFRIPVTTAIAKDSNVQCGNAPSGFDSSALGFINALVDDPICMFIGDNGAAKASEGVFFMPVSEANKITQIKGK